MKRLKNVPIDKAFYVYEGGTIRNLYELAEALSLMKTASFNHHVSAGRNDFANWVRDVIDDSVLASGLMLSKGKSQMEKEVRERIKELEHEHLPAHASNSILRRGAFDFVIGIVIGFVIGLIIASFI